MVTIRSNLLTFGLRPSVKYASTHAQVGVGYRSATIGGPDSRLGKRPLRTTDSHLQRLIRDIQTNYFIKFNIHRRLQR